MKCGGSGCKTPHDCFQQGSVALKTGDKAKAYRYFAAAANDDPANVTYQWAAAHVAPNPQFALFHVKTAWDNGFRTLEALDAYLRLTRITEAAPSLLFALQLYRQLPDSLRTDEVRAGIYLNFKMHDSTIALLTGIFEKKRSCAAANGLAKAYLAKGDNGKAKEFLLECNGKKLLNTEGYTLLNLACLRDFDFSGCASVFEAAKKEGLYSDELKLIHARGLVAQEQYNDAEAILKPFIQVSNTDKNSDFLKNIRMVLAYIYFVNKNRDAIAVLKKSLPGDTGKARVEGLFYEAIMKRIADTSSLVPIVTELLKKIPAYPEIEIILAQELARMGKNNEAVKVYQNLPDVYRGAPRFIIERARLLDLSGKFSDALVMLSLLHSKKIVTRSSLELFRDISFKRNMTDEAAKAQKILETAYKNDVGVRWARGVMGLRNGTYDSAITLFSSLVKEYPDEPRFLYALVSAYFAKGEYDRVIQRCSMKPSTMSSILRLQARAYIKLAKPSQADSLYKFAIAVNKNDIGTKMEYAEFLQHHGSPEKAVALYRELIEKDKDAMGGDSGQAAAIVLNNLAWSLLQSPGGDKEVVLSAIKKAYGIDRQNSSILDTYAEALLRYNDFNGCILLLENSPLTAHEAALLFKLSTAYEKNNNITKAIRTLQDAKKLIESRSPGRISITMSAGDVESRIGSLLAMIKE